MKTIYYNNYNSKVKDYISLMKPRVMSLVVFTGLIGLLLAGQTIHPFLAFVSVLCISLGAGSSAVINMWYDVDIDIMMKRTKFRPLVRGVIDPDEALSFGIILGFLSVLIMAVCINLLAAFLLLFTICYYVFIYTIWLKRSSHYNVVIGGVAGALPPMIGMVSATGDINLESLILFSIIFFWTPAHSWALALYSIDDYKNCNIPMMPVIKGARYTKKQIVCYSIITVLVSLLPFFVYMAGFVYLVIVGICGIILVARAISLFYDNSSQQKAKSFFGYSIIYLFIVFLSLLFG